MIGRIRIDVVVHDGQTTTQACEALAGDTPLLWEVLDERGAGGGWPYVKFLGSTHDLERMLVRYCDGDLDQAGELIDEIELLS